MKQIDAALSPVIKSAVPFFIAYVVLLIPTYYLPYAGSNSAVVNALGSATGYGFLPQFWMHLGCIFLLVVITWLRGCGMGKQWITVFPAIAGVFDLTPGLTLIPLLPTAMHVCALVFGARGSANGPTEPTIPVAGLVVAGLVGFGILSGLGASGLKPTDSSSKQAVKPGVQKEPAVTQPPPSNDSKAAIQQMTKAVIETRERALLGMWSDGGPTCASVRKAKAETRLEIRTWYCEADESVAKPIVVSYDSSAGAFVTKDDGISVKILQENRIQIRSVESVRKALGDGIQLDEDVVILSKSK